MKFEKIFINLKLQRMIASFFSNFTRWANRRLSYAVLPRARSKTNYDFTLGRLAYENLRPVQNPGIDSTTGWTAINT